MKLIAVTTGQQSEKELIKAIQDVALFVDLVILREKQKTPEEYRLFFQSLKGVGVDVEKLAVHNAAELACASGIPNLHLPEKGPSVQVIKQKCPYLKTGVSVHSLESARQAEEQGADYVIFGHIYQTKSKEGVSPRGLHQLEKIASSLDIPVFGIGGITPESIRDLYESGAQGAAVMSGIFSKRDPLRAAKAYKKEAARYV
ncbi:thiamine phosphate synthase [Halobacillus sp. Marseille-Q1614]|uniref:thiamine phosphate synthase n=1 Tax=Halobacillus sp. Marseille-Q1614 TaxID=2709134 RepID=UPI00156D4C93|nr:thiamine phosphate synthase [Halobacillus sp. Marseille-Q1614]